MIERRQALDGSLDLNGTISGVTFSGDMGGTVSGDYAEGDQVGTFEADVSLDVNGGSFARDTDGLLLAAAGLDGGADLTVTTDDGEFDESRDLVGDILVGE